jgi:hypothetical protein
MRRLTVPSALVTFGFLASYLVTTWARRPEPGPDEGPINDPPRPIRTGGGLTVRVRP